MKHVFILITDGNVFLVVQMEGKYCLPNHTFWPITKPIPSHHWPSAILKHLTHGLTEIFGEYTWAPHPFGLPNDTSFVIVKKTFSELQSITQTHERIRKWHKYNASYTCPWRLKLFSIKDTSVGILDLPSTHCVKAFQDMEKKNMIGQTLPSDHIINET